ncbi:hypothetical protein VIBNIAM115_1680057 [Vibrio nigripulchritudo AM115]|nr:hypothetical protein VIBNIAM115_1680057 [Vibrio nigripulchritudo AM115]
MNGKDVKYRRKKLTGSNGAKSRQLVGKPVISYKLKLPR